MSVLRCEGLEAGYARSAPCVRGVDLSIDAGEVVTLLGPNGSGKTTMLLTIAGLMARLGGTVVVGDVPLASGDPRAAVKSGVVLVPDDRALFRRLTVRKNLGLAIRGMGRRSSAVAIDGVLEHFPALRSRLDVSAGQLSGGEQQMLAIARALLQRPRVLMVDELSMGLAPIVVETILPVLRDVAERDGTAVVLVEQHVRLALQVADRAVILVHGDIALQDDATSLANSPERIERAYLGVRKQD